MHDFFEESIYKFEDAKRSEELHFSFKLKDTYSGKDIDYISPGCGSCTEAWYDQESNSVVGVMDLVKAAGQAGKSTLKTITVAFDPKEPDFLVDDKKQRKSNQNKRKQSLRISGTIID